LKLNEIIIIEETHDFKIPVCNILKSLHTMKVGPYFRVETDKVQ